MVLCKTLSCERTFGSTVAPLGIYFCGYHKITLAEESSSTRTLFLLLPLSKNVSLECLVHGARHLGTFYHPADNPRHGQPDDATTHERRKLWLPECSTVFRVGNRFWRLICCLAYSIAPQTTANLRLVWVGVQAIEQKHPKQTENFHCKQWRLTFDGSVSLRWVKTRLKICGAIEYAPGFHCWSRRGWALDMSHDWSQMLKEPTTAGPRHIQMHMQAWLFRQIERQFHKEKHQDRFGSRTDHFAWWAQRKPQNTQKLLIVKSHIVCVIEGNTTAANCCRNPEKFWRKLTRNSSLAYYHSLQTDYWAQHTTMPQRD